MSKNKVRIELNRAGVRELMQSPEMQAVLLEQANKIASAYDISYIVCYNKFGSNMGLATIASDGTVAMKPDTIMIRVNISKNKNPYFGLTKR